MSSSVYVQDMIVSWSDFHRKAKMLAENLLNRRKWDGIIAVTRGGLYPAGIIARELNIQKIDTICVRSYSGQTRGEPELLKTAAGDGENILIVDDLVDSGNTARFIRKILPKGYFVTVFAKPEGKPVVDEFVESVPQDTWIRFPWDTDISFMEPLADLKGKR